MIAINRSSGPGDAINVSPTGDARREGAGSGDAIVVNDGGGDAVRSGSGSGNATRRCRNGGGRRERPRRTPGRGWPATRPSRAARSWAASSTREPPAKGTGWAGGLKNPPTEKRPGARGQRGEEDRRGTAASAARREGDQDHDSPDRDRWNLARRQTRTRLLGTRNTSAGTGQRQGRVAARDRARRRKRDPARQGGR